MIRFVLILAFLAPAAVSFAKPPNVVLIISDDQAWTDFSFMGHKTIRTPALDKLAKQSAVFPNGYVPSSLCRPSLASIITGLYPSAHKIVGNDPKRGVDRSLMLKHIRAAPTIPRLLGKAGYLSHQSGKWWEGNHKVGGFTHGMTHGDPKRRGRHGDVGLEIGRTGMKPIFNFIAEATKEQKPFFVWYAPFLPHTPHNPPAKYLQKYQQPGRPLALAKYYAMCEWFDTTCGQLMDHLDEKKIADDTIVLFVTDNGWIQRTPQSKLPKAWRYRFAPKSKRSPYDGGLRTPIMVRWPGKVKPAKYDTLVSSIDLAPTIYAACGVEKPARLPGLDLVQIANAGGKCSRETLFGEVFAHDQEDIDQPRKSLQFEWCRRGKWKLIVPAKKDSLELYDLSVDPTEITNVAKSNKKIVEELRSAVAKWKR